MDVKVLNILNHREISQLLIKWYEENKRCLPWRDTNDSYRIWVSEVILQQTRVAQGIGYYLRFIEKFPNVNVLAQTSENEVLKLWQGLGYYTRARNLHKGAKTVQTLFDSRLPDAHKEIISIEGIGEYTAAAILSIAYNKPYAVVDGNVFRVLSRLFAIDTPIDSNVGRKLFSALAHELLDITQPGIHNQAIMEFGALHCTPTQPLCISCPLQHLCIAKKLNMQIDFPVKSKKVKVRKRYIHYFQIEYNGFTYLNKRIGVDIWKNLYDFPSIETDENINLSNLMETEFFETLFTDSDVTFLTNPKQYKHVLSHQHIYAAFYVVNATKLNDYFDLNFLKIRTSDVSLYPIPRLIHRYLEQL